MELYHASKQIVQYPEVRKAKYTKDFSWGFYCTNDYEQAYKWADRKSKKGIVNVYSYTTNDNLKILKFDKMTDEWLDFIAMCRAGYIHEYDIVEGPMANDTIFNYVQDFVDGKISRAAFWELAKFKKPTHQISFHTAKALTTLEFLKGYEVNE